MQESEKRKPIEIGITFVGQLGVGKSSIVSRFVNDKFNEKQHATIGLAFHLKLFDHNDAPYNLHIWDAAGQPSFVNAISENLKKTNIFIIVVDVTKNTNDNDIEFWVEYVKTRSKFAGPIILIGNKIDLSPSITLDTKSLESIRDKHDLAAVVEVSAKSGAGLEPNSAFESTLFAQINTLDPEEIKKKQIIPQTSGINSKNKQRKKSYTTPASSLFYYTSRYSDDNYFGKHDRHVRAKWLIDKLNNVEQKIKNGDFDELTEIAQKQLSIEVIYQHYATIRHCGSELSRILESRLAELLAVREEYQTKLGKHWFSKRLGKWSDAVFKFIHGKISMNFKATITEFESDDSKPTVLRNLHYHLDHLERNRLTNTDPEIKATLDIIDYMQSKNFDPGKLLDECGRFCTQQGLHHIPKKLSDYISPIVDVDNVHGFSVNFNG